MSTDNHPRPAEDPDLDGQSPEGQSPAGTVPEHDVVAGAASEAPQDEPLVLPEEMVLPRGADLEELAQSLEIPSLSSDPSAQTVAVNPQVLHAAQETQPLETPASPRRALFPLEAAYPSSEQATVNLSLQRPEVVPPGANLAPAPSPEPVAAAPATEEPRWGAAAQTVQVSPQTAQSAVEQPGTGPTEHLLGTSSPGPAAPPAPGPASEAAAGSSWGLPGSGGAGTTAPPSTGSGTGAGTGAGTSVEGAAPVFPAPLPSAAAAGHPPVAAPGGFPSQPGERPAWPGVTETVPAKERRSDADVLLEGSSVIGQPASRAAWHWGGALLALLLFPFAWYLCHAGKERLADNLPTPGGTFTPGLDVVGLVELGGGLLALLLALLVARKSASGPFLVGLVSVLLGVPFLVAPGATWDFLAPLATRLTDQSTIGANLVRFFIMDGYTGTFILLGLVMVTVGVVAHSTRRAGRREREIMARAKR